MKKPDQSLKKEDILQRVKDGIIRGKWKPGERIIELQLSRELNCGRAKIREALRQLEQEGFITIIPNVGTVVSELSQKDIVQIYDLMGVLEGLSLRIATPFLSRGKIDQIEELVVRVEESRKDPFMMSMHNYEFHRFLTGLSGNERLIQFMENIRTHTYRMRLQTFYSEEQVEASIKEHRQILNAVKDKKAEEAESIIRRHYQDAKGRLIKRDYYTY
jgi:DNA-binding GntR family transcriptional regulator